jgi:hypothetical protein
VLTLCQLSIAGEFTSALSIIYIYIDPQYGTIGCQKPLRGRATGAVGSDASRSPRFQQELGGRQLARIGHHYPGGVNHKTNVYIEKQCRVQCKSNVWNGKTWPYIGFLGLMYGFPIKPCIHGLIGRNANVRGMHALAKHCHTLDFLDHCTDQCTGFPIKPCSHGLISRNANQKSNVRAEKL